eukprot:CAMPEP_0113652330 /NCGR_PEP_ID=MMETSP0017_2-20120614/27944_1 /TAXON_ID=2856 /ORGANISM="Cylindrotheca closterium" /LENGTH=1480 /DNA_ID=CAMNT_0000565161 /DNA_START=102 /DNA_END=4541 /DNA_ORIENTATION=- /assembly_acc=CAM_ASM_000147
MAETGDPAMDIQEELQALKRSFEAMTETGDPAMDIQEELQASKRSFEAMTETGDPAMDIQEELQALKRSFKLDISNLQEKNAELEAKNADLEEKHLDAKKAISELRNLVQKNGRIIDKDEGDDSILMNTNAYTFLYTSALCSAPFIAGVVTSLIQYTVFSLFLLDLLNTTSIPPGVTTLVRACQAIAIIIAFLVETDMLTALRGMFYREGFDEMANAFDGFAPWKFYFANALMGMQGLLGKFVAFSLITFADNVFDLLLNFTAVMFVSELDEIVFLLSKAGYVGRRAERLAKKIQKMKLPQRPPNGNLRHVHLFLYGLTLVAAFIAFAFVVHQQDSQNSLADFVKVQFGDEVDPTLGLFSGCYEKQLKDGWDARVRYVQTQSDRGQGDFEYCLVDGLQTWVFAIVQSKTACDDNFALRSSEERSTSFDLLDAKGDQWLFETGNAISEFQLGEIDPSRFEIECGTISVKGDTTSSTEELCPVMTVDVDAIGFSGSHDWSKTFVLLENLNSEVVQFYQRPVFIGDSLGSEGYELLFFAGRRWVLATTKLLTEDDDPFNMENVISLFESSGFWLLELRTEALSYLSEAVNQGNDRGTPLGLQWYNARYADGVAFPFADISRPVDGSFRCGKCNSRTNPCLYEGICQDDGTCICSHGTSGRLCEIKPLSDGVCNPFFNTAPDEYDGGDCCVATCSKANCGVGEMNFAFGQSLQRNGTGFPNCNDPSMVPLTIYLETEIVEDAGSGFASYTVELHCEEADTTPMRVALDPSIVGTLNETVYVDDKAGSCLLSFIGIQSWTGLNISYQIMDGLDSSADSMLLMNEERNITADGIFALPTVYSRCLKETLAGVVDAHDLYTGSYQDEAFARLSNEATKFENCSSNQEYLIERYSLVALSTAEEAPESWISSKDHCLWSRVTCDGSRVVELTYDGLTNGALKGLLAPEFTLLRHSERIDVFGNEFSESTIPTEVGTLSALTSLLLSINGLSGTVPTEVGKLTALTDLRLNDNALSGTIPSEVGKLTALTDLRLYDNALSGTIPSEVGKLIALSYLSLRTNALSGTVPSEVGSMSALTDLRLFDNALSGTLPSEVGKLGALKILSLRDNALSGTIPSQVGNLGAMKLLSLRDNSLSGTLPSEVGSMSALTALYLYGNRLSGSIPSELGNMTALKTMWLYNNALSGALPSEIGNMSALAALRLNGNRLSGTIPSQVGNLSALTVLNLNNNALPGTIPSEVGNLSALTKLWLYNNTLSGTIPSEVGNLSALIALQLHTNALSGTIPSEVGNWISLAVLGLYNNMFSGSLPSEIGLLDNLLYLNLRNNVLNGTLPSEIGLLTNLQYLILEGNKLSGPLPTEILRLTNLTQLELSGNLFSEEEVDEVMVSLGLDFSCNETIVEMALTSDHSPDETTWEITIGDGSVVASGGGYVLESITHDEKVCVPLDGCNFTLFDQDEDGGPTVEITRLGKVYQIDGAFTNQVVVDICAKC